MRSSSCTVYSPHPILRRKVSYDMALEVIASVTIMGLASSRASNSSSTHLTHTHPPLPAPQAKDRFRLNLLAAWPPLRPLLRSSLWPNDINFKCVPRWAHSQ